MSKIPKAVIHDNAGTNLLKLVSRGKVRDTYELGGNHLLPAASDRISIYDFVLRAEIPQKGEVLTALNAFWFKKLRDAGFPQDIVALGAGIDQCVPEKTIDDFPDIRKRAMAVKKLNMIPVEAIVRGYLTGSGWSAYQETAPDHIVCGHRLPSGLKDGDRLPEPIFTPTTKAAEGHDEHLDFNDVNSRFGPELGQAALKLFKIASDVALKRGIIIADTKFEFGIDQSTGKLTLGDERLTPDSSRFWLLDDWKRSRNEGRSPVSFDKQYVREWGKTVGVDKRDPKKQKDVRYVHGLEVPREVVMMTRQIYRYILYLITGKRLEDFQLENMGVSTPLPPVEIVLGSESDVEQARPGLEYLSSIRAPYRVHIISCHRNPEKLRRYAEKDVPENATIIAAAGKAAALPGVLQAWLRHYGKGHVPVLGVAMTSENSSDNKAAELSIERLPGNPVVMNEEGKAYAGITGFTTACKDAVEAEFLIRPAKTKEAKINFITSVL